jgi:hypothetical protein
LCHLYSLAEKPCDLEPAATAPKAPLLKSDKRGKRLTPEHLQTHVVISVVGLSDGAQRVVRLLMTGH